MNIKNFFHKFYWKDFWYNQISTRINHRNKWALKIIPRQWRDKDFLIENFLYASIIDYVEGEKCFETIVWENNESDKNNKNKIKEIYHWAKTGRNKKQIELENSYPDIPDIPENVGLLDWIKNKNDKYGTYEELYGKSVAIETFINDKDDEYLAWIIKNRKILWT